MNLEDQLIDRLVQTYNIEGRSLHSILDNPMFRDLPLDKKVSFIKSYSEQLRQAPRFNWTAGVTGAVTGTASALGTLALSAMALGGKIPSGSLGVAAGVGAATGAALGLYKAKLNQDRDISTSRNIDDAIKVLIDRQGFPDTITAEKSVDRVQTTGITNMMLLARSLDAQRQASQIK